MTYLLEWNPCRLNASTGVSDHIFHKLTGLEGINWYTRGCFSWSFFTWNLKGNGKEFFIYHTFIHVLLVLFLLLVLTFVPSWSSFLKTTKTSWSLFSSSSSFSSTYPSSSSFPFCSFSFSCSCCCTSSQFFFFSLFSFLFYISWFFFLLL